MDELVEWYGQQLDEDERIARATTWEGSGNKLGWELVASATIDVGGDEFYVGDRTIANHMMAWEPARVLREIDAKRRMLERHAARYSEPAGGMICAHDGHRWPCPDVRDFAAVYADRPGYKESWRP